MKRAFIAISLWVASALTFASPEVDRVEAALQSGDGAAVVKALSNIEAPDAEFGKYIQAVILKYPNNQRETQELKGLIRLSRIASGEPAPVVADVSQVAKQERKKAEYFDPGQKSQSNWVGKGTEGLRKWIESLREDLTRSELPEYGGPSPNFSVPDAFVAFVRVLVLLAVAALAVILISYLYKTYYRPMTMRNRAALISEEETLRTEDEWLVQARELMAAGRHRDAIRCLYVAMLLRAQEAGHLKFVRTDTNWEHYRRFFARSGTLFDLRPATSEFDYFWYGERPAGPDESGWFLNQYQEFKAALAKGAHAKD